jgi:prophage antirepressor-like protein
VKFEFKGFEIEAIRDNETPMFMAKDVAVLLNLDTLNLSTFLKNNLRGKDYRTISGKSKGRPPYFVTEAGLYDMIFGSNCEYSQDFKYWIFDEVLPSIRKDGAYISPDITPQQAIAAIDKLSQVADLASPWEKMWSRPVLDLVRKFYGNFCDKTFWWKYIYDFLTPEERCKLDRINPVNTATKQRKTRIHQWIETEGEIKDRLTEKVNEVQVLLRTSSTRSDFEARYQKLLGGFQGEFF